MNAYTSEQYRTLCDMIAKGVTSLEQNGEKVTFRSLAEMRQIKSEMEQSLGLRAPRRVHYPTFVKG
ncbi:phage head-tail joining protein [Pseudogemmobacter faecipullorum]|uniref:Uncharacterized protein n=1 Tax=Pseudogemmobacter faecipullorum TaxID=2755041 RepID=A0ABS8CU85_9RHOB|nr:hypothetical protein [Pseudogemmobacter faecipullorum]MCB5412385.1 hypothetical protein [Pseudogemmobacter faecipullorum]